MKEKNNVLVQKNWNTHTLVELVTSGECGRKGWYHNVKIPFSPRGKHLIGFKWLISRFHK